MDKALHAILDVHARSTLQAGEYPNGRCTFCEKGATHEGREPLRRFRDNLNWSKVKVWLHEHPDPAPYCEECAAGYDGRADWPCRTAKLAATGLGIELT